MTAPVRLQLSRAKGFDLQALSQETNGLPAIVVARPGLYGNPFVHDDVEQAVTAFRRYCLGGTQSFEMGPGKLQFAPGAHANSLHWAWPDWLRNEGIPKIRGKNLACWCKPGTPCHADVLLELANRPICEAVG